MGTFPGRVSRNDGRSTEIPLGDEVDYLCGRSVGTVLLFDVSVKGKGQIRREKIKPIELK